MHHWQNAIKHLHHPPGCFLVTSSVFKPLISAAYSLDDRLSLPFCQRNNCHAFKYESIWKWSFCLKWWVRILIYCKFLAWQSSSVASAAINCFVDYQNIVNFLILEFSRTWKLHSTGQSYFQDMWHVYDLKNIVISCLNMGLE